MAIANIIQRYLPNNIHQKWKFHHSPVLFLFSPLISNPKEPEEIWWCHFRGSDLVGSFGGYDVLLLSFLMWSLNDISIYFYSYLLLLRYEISHLGCGSHMFVVWRYVSLSARCIQNKLLHRNSSLDWRHLPASESRIICIYIFTDMLIRKLRGKHWVLLTYNASVAML